MVRIISQGFTTPRSRHSSGEEMINRFAAMKAVSALNDNEKHQLFFKDSNHNIETKKLIIDCSTDTNDSFSCGDSEEDARSEKGCEKGLQGNLSYQDPTVVKKERRRERNKLSAQSYRQRRKVQTGSVQKTLESLEAHHKILMEKVRHLEAEKHIVEEYLKNCVKIPWCPYHQPCNPVNCSPPPVNCSPPPVNCSPPPVNCSPPPVNCNSSSVNCSPPQTACSLPLQLENCRDPCQPTPPSCSPVFCSPDNNANVVANGNQYMPLSGVPQMSMHQVPMGTGNLNDMSLRMSGASTAQSSDSLVS